jgi:hypothetical protein
MRVFPYSQKPKHKVRFTNRLVHMMNFFDWFMLTCDTTGNMTGKAMKAIAKFNYENHPSTKIHP